MQTRRSFVAGATIISLTPILPSLALAEGDDRSFADLFASTLRSPGLLEASGHSVEGRELELEIYGSSKAIAPRYAPSTRTISPDAIKMIIAAEVSGERRYTAHLRGAIWPKGKSGVTMGFGYDVGYVTGEWLRSDWSDILPAKVIALLIRACGVHGPAAARLLTLFGSLDIPWTDADRQFRTTSLPRYVAEVLHVLPNADRLSGDCLGAIVSLVYNRGPSFQLRKSGKVDRYTEMRAIRLHMVNEDYRLIPGEIRAMKRLWANDPNSAGLLVRRELEARLFERGLGAIKAGGA